jgi:hypothetical protein
MMQVSIPSGSKDFPLPEIQVCPNQLRAHSHPIQWVEQVSMGVRGPGHKVEQSRAPRADISDTCRVLSLFLYS